MIRIAESQDKALWNTYVDQHAQGTFFHLYEWREVIDSAIKHKTYYLIAEEAGVVTGLLPLTHVKSLLFGNNLVSNPFCVYGGPIADSNETIIKLLDYATELSKELKVDSLELRNLQPIDFALPQGVDLKTKDLYVTFQKELFQDHDENLKAIPRKQRAMVRKGIKLGLEYEVENELENFMFAYESSVRNLGTPVFSRKYFDTLANFFTDKFDVLTVKNEGKVVSSVLSFYYKDTVFPYYGGGTMDARRLAANDFMYWSLMEHSVNRGIKTFDYGRSKKDTGAYSFKKNWGFVPAPLYYQYYLNAATAVPEINPTNPKYRLFIEAWKRMPLPLARIIGPMLSRNLG